MSSSSSSDTSFETVRLRFMSLASWHRDISQLDEAMAKVLGHHKSHPLPPGTISMDHDSNLVMMNYTFDLIRRVARLELLHYIIELDPPLANAMQHPVVPPEPKRLADKLGRQLSLIPDPTIQGLLKCARAGEFVPLKMSEDGSAAIISDS